MGLLSPPRSPVRLPTPAAPDAGHIRAKVGLLGVFVLVLFGVLTIQLVRLQIFRHDEFETRAAVNRIRTTNTPAIRGLIFDRDGTPLVENVPAFAITVVPADIPDAAAHAVALRLGPLLGLAPYDIETDILEGRRSIDPFLPVVLEPNADKELAFRIAGLQGEIPGLQVEAAASRSYPTGALLADILGYVGPITREEYDRLRADRYRLADRIGQTGVEAAYEAVLRGAPGRRQTEVNAAGRELRTIQDEPPTPGRGLVLTIDLNLQARIQEILTASLGGSLFASAVVMDVRTGEILALVSVPTYDNNLFAGAVDEATLQAILEDPGRPLVNHAIADQFPPGSIFKVVTGTAALQEGIISPDQEIFSPGVIEVQNAVDPRITYTFRDTTSGVFDFRRGLAESSNVYFWYLAGGSPYRRPVAEELLTPDDQAEQRRLVQAGIIGGNQDFLGLGAETLAQWSRAFGFDAPTHIDLAGEAAGFIPDPAWKLQTFSEGWGQGDSYNFGIGQGFVAVTPIQMAVATAAIANGGLLLQPRVVREILDASGNLLQPFSPTIVRDLQLQPATVDALHDGMALSVLAGTSGNAWFTEMQVAGKTGTAEFGTDRLFRGNFPTHGWFIGFAPFEDPQVAIVVFHELGAGYISAIAGGEIMRAWAETSGSIGTYHPALGQARSIAPEEFNRLLTLLDGIQS